MLEALSNLLLELFKSTGLVGIFIITAIESLFAPIPSEVILVYAGLYVKSIGGYENLIPLSIVGALGNFVGTLPFYYISKFTSDKYTSSWVKKWGKYLLISKEDIGKVQKFFNKRGMITIFLAKLIPGMRSFIAIPAGLANVDFTKYFLLSISGSFIWNMFLGTIGFVAYDQQDAVFAFLKPIENIILAIFIGVVLFYIFKVVQNFRKISKEG